MHPLRSYFSHSDSLVIIILFCAVAIFTAGCNQDEGPPGVDVWGTVTWKGQPVPTGVIIFKADVKQGNTSHQGIANIVDGRYDTRNEGGRRVGTGRQIIVVHGFDAPSANSSRSKGDRMFLPYEYGIDAPTEPGELNIVVPDSVPKLIAPPRDESF